MRSRIALFVLFILSAVTLAAQTIPGPLAEEAPETLFDFVVSDAEVSLFATGSWVTGFAPAFGWVFTRDPAGELTAAAGYPFPGIQSVAFFNRVNLTLSLWLAGRYFFETTVSEDIASSTILFGYAGRADESVQSVIIGNTSIGMGSYPYLGFGDESGSIGQDAPGISAAFSTPVSSHEMMVRFAPAEEQEIRYANGGIVSESRVNASEYDVNRHFVLPDANLDFLEVYAESSDGAVQSADGRRYRRVDLSRETTFSLIDGTLSFNEPPRTRVLVYYEVGAVPIGDTSLGRDSYFALDATGSPDSGDVRDFDYTDLRTDPSSASDYFDALFGLGFPIADQEFDIDSLIVDLDGDEAFVIHEPGRFAPFASAAYYPLVDDSATAIFVEPADPTTGESPLRVTPLTAQEVVRVAATTTDPRAYGNRYPFASSTVASPAPGIYGPEAAPQPDAAEVVFQSVSRVDRIVLPSGFIPGSVRITRNGVAENRYSVTDSGEIVFDRPLTTTDVVQVAFRSSASAESGDLLFGSGNTFALGRGTIAQIALGARWKPIGQRFSTRPGEYPGRLTLSGSVSTDSRDWRTPREYTLESEVRAAVTLSSPDTSGVLRVAGMNENGRSIPMAVNGMFASPPPVAAPHPTVDATTLVAASRGRLRYADYYQTGVLGARELLPYSVEVEPEPYSPAGRAGPYPASSSDAAYAGNVALFEYEIGTSQNWAAGIVRVDGGNGSDFSGTRSIVVPYRVLESIGTAQLFVQVGAIAEDLDSDGTLDTGTGGLPFDDDAAGISLPTGAIPTAGTSYSEDANGNGVLDAELPDRVLSFEIVDSDIASSATTGGAPWRFAEIQLTSAEASRLAETRAVRFLVYSSAGDVTGRIAFGALETNGSSFAVSVPRDGVSDPSVTVSERAESDFSGDTLATVFPNVVSRFAADDPTPRLLSAEWTGLGTDTINVARSSSIPASDYEQLRLFYRLPDGAADDVILTLRAAAGSTVIAESTVTVTQSRWDELLLELPTDRSEIITRLEIDISGPDVGAVLLDELSFWEPRTSIGSIASGQLRWRPGFQVLLGATSVVSDLVLEQTFTAQTASFPDDVGLTRSGFQSSTDVDATVFAARTAIGVDLLSNQLGSGVQVRHRLALPIASTVELVDEYRVGYRQLEPGSTHSLGASVRLGRFASAGLDWLSDQRDSSRVDWGLDVDFSRTRARQDGGDSRASEDSRAALSVSTAVNVDLAEQREPTAVSGSYPSSWISSYTDFVPWISPGNRGGSAGVDNTVEIGRVRIDLAADAGFESDERTNRGATFASLSLASPIQITDRVDLTVEIAREVTLTATGRPEATPPEDVARAASLFAEHPLLFRFLPVVELVTDAYADETASLTDGLLAASYLPTVSVDLRRRITSLPRSLLLPTAVRATVGRPAQRTEDASSTSYELGLDAVFIAPNLFGRLGTTPTFDWYDTDEYQAEVSVTSSGGDGAPWNTEIGADTRVRMLWTGSDSLVLENVLSTGLSSDSETRLATSLAWTRPGSPERVEFLPLPPLLANLERAVEHISRFEIEYRSRVDTSVFGRIKHETTVELGEGSSIRVHGALGLGAEQAGSSRQTMIGLQMGIEGRLRL